MIRAASNRNSKFLLTCLGICLFITFLYFSSNTASYKDQLSDHDFLKNTNGNLNKLNEAHMLDPTEDEKFHAAVIDSINGKKPATDSYLEDQHDEHDTDFFEEKGKADTPSKESKGKGSSEMDSVSDPKKNRKKVPAADKQFSVEKQNAAAAVAASENDKTKIEENRAAELAAEQLKAAESVDEHAAELAAQAAGIDLPTEEAVEHNSFADDASSEKLSSGGSKDKALSSSSGLKDGNCKLDPEYVVMIDAGSSGSRVHVYKFDVCYSPPKLLNEDFKMLKPGLSSFDTDTIGAAKSLDPLLELAVESVPKKSQGCTPIAVKATAGLRLLGDQKADAILKQVRNYLEKEWPFAVVEGNGISIMDGADEGVYAWITANYLMGNIGSSEKLPTAAVFDLGGGSTQIVFEPEFKDQNVMVEGEHKYKLNFGDRDFELYQYSHLGYGLMEGRNKINKLILESYLSSDKKPANLVPIHQGSHQSEDPVTLNSPCMAPGSIANNVKIKLSDDQIYLVNFKGPESPSGPQCRFLAEKVLNKDMECTEAPCSFNGVHQPSLMKNFQKSNDMYIFSFFYDRTNPLGMPSSFTLEEMSDLAKVVCNGNSFWETMLSGIDGSLKELESEPFYCLDLSFMVAMLHTGYEIPLNRELKTAKTIAGNELGWCLGASLPLLEKKDWKCRVTQQA